MANAELDGLWTEFHGFVNMTGHELRTWLLTEASGEEGFRAAPDAADRGLGKRVLDVLDKRKADLTADDVDVMGKAVGHMRRLLAQRPPAAENDVTWRHALMDLGHDPLKASSPRGEAEPP